MIPFHELKVVQGGEERLECHITGIPTPIVEWHYNGELINNTNQRISSGIESDSSSGQAPEDIDTSFSSTIIHYLHIRNVQTEDAGRYTCKAVNRAGETRQNIQLYILGLFSDLDILKSVLVHPSIADGERLLRSAEGETLALDCLAKGNPTPEIIWRKDQELISPQPSPLKSRLFLKNLSATDSARCINILFLNFFII